MGQLYQAENSDQLISHALDSMTLIFQKTSGITHIVADPIPAILEVMGYEPVSPIEIARKLSESFDMEQGVDVEGVVVARLEELRALGLVERVGG